MESFRITAQELVALARRQGIDLDPLRKDFSFQEGRRWIDVWRKDALPGTGPAEEPQGSLHFSMQGAVSVLPHRLKGSASAFQGMWSEAGTIETLEQALELVKAWLLDRKEVDDLPNRSVRRYSI